MKPPSRLPKLSSLFPFTLMFVACLFLSGVSSAAPSITLSKTSGPPTTRILVSGRGFEPNVGVDIYFGTHDEALIVTDGHGDFKNAGIRAPRSAPPGKHWVTALERDNDKGAQELFLVQTNWSQFHFTADGTRLNPYENVLNPRNVTDLGLKWIFSEGGDCTVAVADGVVYMRGGSYDNTLYAVDAQTGTQRWSYAVSGGGRINELPAVADGVVYFGADNGSLYALNAHTGALLWTYTTGRPVYSSPAVANNVVYITSEDGNLYALSAHSGAKVWSYPAGGDSTAVVANGVVYFGSSDHSVYALKSENGSLLWSYQTGSSAGDLTVTGGVVYATSQDDSVYALNASNGEKLWSYKTNSMILYAPAVADGVVYVGSGNLDALNTLTGRLLWSFGYSNSNPSSPAVANGVVYFFTSNDGVLYGLNARNGSALWSYNFGLPGSSSTTITNGVLYLASYAFGLPRYDEQKNEDLGLPDLKTLHPDLSLKASNQSAAAQTP